MLVLAIAILVMNGKGVVSADGDELTPKEIASVSFYVLYKAYLRGDRRT